MCPKGILLTAAAIVVMAASASGQLYYGTDGPIPLKIDSSKVAVKFDASITPFAREQLIASIDRIDQELDDDHMIDGFNAFSLVSAVGYEGFLDSLDAIAGIYLVEPYYLAQIDSPMVVGETFCVAFDTTLTYDQIDSINASFKVVVDHELFGMPKVYLLRNTDSSGYRVLELANTYHDWVQVTYAHPEFGVRVVKCSYKVYDYYHPYQLHTKKVIGQFNIKSVWDFAGLDDPIIVAVLDDGIISHEDLPASRILEGYDFSSYDDTTTPGPAVAHGMGCAGIIASSHTTDSLEGLQTSSGVLSLDSHVKILPVKVFYDNGWGTFGSQVAEAVSYADTMGADVLSNSWGFARPDFEEPVLTDALQRAFMNGRNGRGCPVIFAAGNGATSYPNKVAYPAKLWSCFAVGATDLDDYRWYYSQYGPELDIVAPSGNVNLQGDVWTLDQMGNLGWNPSVAVTWDCPSVASNDKDYDCKFGGTSAACPVVSGIAALLLARNPNLNSERIYYILRMSAVTDLDWGSITAPNNEYGYGRVDAFRAMLAITRGDANNDDHVNLADASYIINYAFKGGPPPKPDEGTGDANCDGLVDLSDAIFVINYVFKGGPEPAICFEYDY